MYELLVLGMLMSRDMSGYKLRDVLGSALVPRRKLSNGVMYPLLSKLEKAGDIIFIEEPKDPRNKKLARITETGKIHFFDLMRQPVPDNARNESIYRFKFRGMFALSFQEQQTILQDYANKVQADLNIYNQVHQHLIQLSTEDTSNKAAIHAGIQSINLSITICQAKQTWINQYLSEIQNKEQQNDSKN